MILTAQDHSTCFCCRRQRLWGGRVEKSGMYSTTCHTHFCTASCKKGFTHRHLNLAALSIIVYHSRWPRIWGTQSLSWHLEISRPLSGRRGLFCLLHLGEYCTKMDEWDVRLLKFFAVTRLLVNCNPNFITVSCAWFHDCDFWKSSEVQALAAVYSL